MSRTRRSPSLFFLRRRANFAAKPRAPVPRATPAARFVHAAAAGTFWRRARGHPLTPPASMAAHLLMLQAVGLGGMWRYAKGERGGLYRKADRLA